MTADEIHLLASASPLKAQLADGTVQFAFQVRRGSVSSPVRMLDVDPAKDGVQGRSSTRFPPHIVGLGATGTSRATLRTDVRDVVFYGRASEKLSKALVTTVLGDNETTPRRDAPRRRLRGRRDLHRRADPARHRLADGPAGSISR
jgi:hypothetical protein